jgi:hypothetical protein
MKVSFRPGAPGVLSLKKTAATFVATPGTNMGPALDGAEFALQMLRFPYRQVFGDTSVGTPVIRDVFKPTIALAQLRSQFERVLR